MVFVKDYAVSNPTRPGIKYRDDLISVFFKTINAPFVDMSENWI